MSTSKVDLIARAVLYEGYVLYPYRPSVKTHQRWTFGGVFPQIYSESHGESDPCAMQTQVLITSAPSTSIKLTLRFLHLIDRAVEQAPGFVRVDSLRVGDEEIQSWQEALEREVTLSNLLIRELLAAPRQVPFAFPSNQQFEEIRNAADGRGIVGRIVRTQRDVAGTIELSAEQLAEGLTKLNIRVVNQTPIAMTENRDRAILCSFASTHFVLHAADGAFVSMTDPPAAAAEAAAQCQSIGCWPVLVGETDEKDTLLVSPIILPDYPQIAPESPGDLFDGCEIDEILTLRIMTLTDAEKRAVAGGDERARQMLARTETLARDQLASLHGAMRPSNMPVHGARP